MKLKRITDEDIHRIYFDYPGRKRDGAWSAIEYAEIVSQAQLDYDQKQVDELAARIKRGYQQIISDLKRKLVLK